MTQALSYSLKVWLTTIVLCPILSIITLLIQVGSLNEAIKVLMLLIGSPLLALMIGLLTIPSAIIFYIFSNYLLKKEVKKFVAKIILSFLGILLTVLTTIVFGDFRFTFNFLFIISPYLISILLSIWIYGFVGSKYLSIEV